MAPTDQGAENRAEEHRKTFLAFYDAFNRHDEGQLRNILAPDFVNHEAPSPAFTDAGPDGVIGWARDMWAAMPDIHIDVHDLLAEGDRAVGRLSVHGTHTGPLWGMPPTGRPVEFESMDMVRIADGRAVEHWGVTDAQAMLTQLGVAPGEGVTETVAAIYEAFGRQDVPAILGMMADDVRWEEGTVDHGVPWMKPGTGPQAVGAFFAALGERLDIARFEVRSMLASGTQVAVIVDLDVTDRVSGQDLSDPAELHLWTVEDRRVTAFRHYVDTHRHVLTMR